MPPRTLLPSIISERRFARIAAVLLLFLEAVRVPPLFTGGDPQFWYAGRESWTEVAILTGIVRTDRMSHQGVELRDFSRRTGF